MRACLILILLGLAGAPLCGQPHPSLGSGPGSALETLQNAISLIGTVAGIGSPPDRIALQDALNTGMIECNDNLGHGTIAGVPACQTRIPGVPLDALEIKAGPSPKGIMINKPELAKVKEREGIEAIALTLVHELKHYCYQDIRDVKDYSSVKKLSLTCARWYWRTELEPVCQEIASMNQVWPMPNLNQKAAIAFAKARKEHCTNRYFEYLNACTSFAGPNDPASVVCADSTRQWRLNGETVDFFQIFPYNPKLRWLNPSTVEFEEIDLGFTVLKDLYYAHNVLVCCGESASGGRVVALNATSRAILSTLVIANRSFGAVAWDQARSILYLHDDIGFELLKGGYSGATLPGVFMVWAASTSPSSFAELRADVELGIKVDGSVEVTPAGYNPTLPTDKRYTYKEVGGPLVRTFEQNDDRVYPRLASRPTDGASTAQLAGKYGNSFQLVDLERTLTYATGTFGPLTSVTTSQSFTLRSRVRLDDTTAGHTSSVAVPTREQGTAHDHSNGFKMTVASVHPPFVNDPNFTIYGTSMDAGDFCVLLIGLVGVSGVQMNPDGSAQITNPTGSAEVTATSIYPQLSGVGNGIARVPMPIPNDPVLANTVPMYQLATWDPIAEEWRLSEVETVHLWSANPLLGWTVPYPPPQQSQAASSTNSSRKETLRHHLRWLGDCGFKPGDAALRPPRH